MAQLEQLENKVYQELLVIPVRLEQRGRKALLGRLERLVN